ncbi:MAG TPA: isochorismatase family cysteine hydrolase [Steroidobacteraceae bacterium]|nr:isochorismatase family cysteine hydrolase [Steroidobacteraceae bacterium]
MHKIEISPELIERLTTERGGRLHLFEEVDPARTAHVIIDMQNGFMEPGAPVEVPVAREIVPNVNAISRAVRSAGALNIFVRFTTPAGGLEQWSSFYSRFSPQTRRAHQEAFAPGAHYWQLWPELDVREDEAKVDKGRFAAFIPGTCDLHSILQERGIDTLIISGTLTNCCCESTARDAMQLNYKVIFVSDANATFTDAEHNATLNNMCALFADVMSTAEVLDVLQRSAARAARPVRVASGG